MSITRGWIGQTLILVALLGCGGCFDFSVKTTTLSITDPSQVVVRDEDGDVVLPAGAPGEGVLHEGRVQVGATSSAAYSVSALREQDRSLSFEWHTQLPVSGERVLLLPADGQLQLSGLADEVLPPEQRGSEGLAIKSCTMITDSSGRIHIVNGNLVHDSYGVVANGCLGRFMSGYPLERVPYELDIPRNNVVVREKRSYRRGTAVLALVAGTLTMGALGGFLMAEHDHLRGGPKVAYGLGGATMAFMLPFDIPAIIALAHKDRERVVYPTR